MESGKLLGCCGIFWAKVVAMGQEVAGLGFMVCR